MHIKAALFLFFFSLLLFLPIFSDPLLDRTSDLDGMVSQIIFIKDTLVHDHIFPQWNPFINQGIPVSADPLHGAFHPLVLPAFMLFSPEVAVKILFFLSALIGGWGMYLLLYRLKIFTLLAVIGAATYVSSGYMISHLVAGHFEKILSFAFLPWFILNLYTAYKKPHAPYEIATACCMTLILFSGDIYNALYSCILVITSGLIRFRRTSVISSVRILLYFCLLGSIKLIPLIELQHYIEKIKEPFVGGQNLISFLYYFFLPIKQVFISLKVGEYLTTGFAWWEKMAYVGPVYLLGLVLLFTRKKTIFNKQLQFFFGSLIILLLLAMPHLKLNPINWLLHGVSPLQLFHVPSRVFGFLTVIVLTLSTLGLQKIYASTDMKRKYGLRAILLVNLTTTLLFTSFVFNSMNMGLRPSQTSTELINDIKRRDGGVFYIAQYLQEQPLSQHTVIANHQKVLNSNYGLQLKDSPAAKFTGFDFTHQKYDDIQPKYFIGRNTIRVPHGSEPSRLLKKDTTYVYKNAQADPYAELMNQEIAINNILFKPNTIEISVDSDRADELLVAESYYPGWQATVDSRKLSLIQDRFLRVPVSEGEHRYRFMFNSHMFIFGLAISCMAWSYALITLFRNRRMHL